MLLDGRKSSNNWTFLKCAMGRGKGVPSIEERNPSPERTNSEEECWADNELQKEEAGPNNTTSTKIEQTVEREEENWKTQKFQKHGYHQKHLNYQRPRWRARNRTALQISKITKSTDCELQKRDTPQSTKITKIINMTGCRYETELHQKVPISPKAPKSTGLGWVSEKNQNHRIHQKHRIRDALQKCTKKHQIYAKH